MVPNRHRAAVRSCNQAVIFGPASNVSSCLRVCIIVNGIRTYLDPRDVRAIPLTTNPSPSGIGSEIRWNSSPYSVTCRWLAYPSSLSLSQMTTCLTLCFVMAAHHLCLGPVNFEDRRMSWKWSHHPALSAGAAAIWSVHSICRAHP